jgi:excisionase family DNA binding protein
VEWPGRIGPADEVTIQEAADMLGVTPGTVAAAVETGELAARTVGSVPYISVADIEVYRLGPQVATDSAAVPPALRLVG